MSSTRWPDQFLDSMRRVTDPVADDVVDTLFEQGEVGAVNALMHELIANDQLVSDRLPSVVQRYLKETCAIPEWADSEKIKRAESFFAKNGLLITTTLTCASLPRCYACANGVQVLYLTARLETDTKRRIGETGQMVLDVMAPGGLAPLGNGIRDAQKVRLMHAAVRHLILRSGRWNQEWGAPINQEDLAGTLMSFSWTPLDCLRRLGIAVEPQDGEAYIHGWNVVGHLMGMRPEMLPANMVEAEELIDLIGRRHFASSEAGREMTAALIDMVEETIPGPVFKGLPRTLIRFFLGDHIADLIGVPKGDWTRQLIGPMGKVFGIIEGEEDRSSILARVGEQFGREFNKGLSWVARGGQRAPFEIPAALRERWDI